MFHSSKEIAEKAMSVEGLMSAEELIFLCECSREAVIRGAQMAVEIGSYQGRSTTALALSLPFPIVAVDTWSLHPTQSRYREAYPKFLENVWFFVGKSKVLPINAFSKDAVEIYKSFLGIPAGLIFIDGNHHYDQVKQDIESWVPVLSDKGGLLIFHDYTPTKKYGVGVVKAVDELLAAGWKVFGKGGTIIALERE